MTQDRKDEVTRLMSQLDIEMQDYIIDTLRHLKFAQNTLCKKRVEMHGDNQSQGLKEHE